MNQGAKKKAASRRTKSTHDNQEDYQPTSQQGWQDEDNNRGNQLDNGRNSGNS